MFIRDFFVRPTYGRLVPGTSGKTIDFIKISEEAQKRWAEESDPLIIFPDVCNPWPAYEFNALLECPGQPIRAEYRGSRRRIIWFGNDITIGMDVILAKILDYVNWERAAEDY